MSYLKETSRFPCFTASLIPLSSSPFATFPYSIFPIPYSIFPIHHSLIHMPNYSSSSSSSCNDNTFNRYIDMNLDEDYAAALDHAQAKHLYQRMTASTKRQSYHQHAADLKTSQRAAKRLLRASRASNRDLKNLSRYE